MKHIANARFAIKAWDEKPYRELDDGTRFSRADVTLRGPEDGLTSGTSESLLFYRADGTSSFVTVMHLTGTVGGRSGGFVLQGQGTYDGTTARVETRVVEGSGTGGLAGLRGTAESVSTHADYPYMPLSLRYDIE